MESRQPRDSFETLDLADLEDAPGATDSESGLRRLPVAPPPLPSATSSWRLDPAPVEDPASERVDLDAVVEQLSTRPLGAPPPVAFSAPTFAERRAPRLLAGAVAAAVIGAAYFGGVATAHLWQASASAPAVTPSPTASEPPPASIDPVVIAAARPTAPRAEDAARERGEAPSTALAPTVFAPTATPPRARPARSTPSTEPSVADAPIAEAAGVPVDEAPVSAVPVSEVPSREDVRAALAAVTPAIEACASEDDAGRIARVRFTFVSQGRAVHALATGVSGPTASCIAAAARQARVAPFARESFAVEYPFAL